jgi:hypothetical protein
MGKFSNFISKDQPGCEKYLVLMDVSIVKKIWIMLGGIIIKQCFLDMFPRS